MDVFKAIKVRKSVRSYSSTPIPNKILLKILKAAQLAPSAGNIQPWNFIVVKDARKRKKFAQASYAKFLVKSPIVIIGCGDQKASPNWYIVDVSIALEHMVLTATSEGLGTCWVGSFNESEVKEMLKIPENFRVVALLALGYPREKTGLTKKIVPERKKMEDIASSEEFGKFKII